LATLGLAGCSSMSQDLGLQRNGPDEYTVTTRAPLSMPSDFSLPPPTPGAPRPQEPSAELSAEAVLDPSVELQAHPGADSAGQDALVAAAGPAAAPDIRTYLDDHAETLNRESSFASTIAFWKKAPTPGKAIDAAKEAARLRAIGVPTMSAPAVAGS
jgi:hypothetical protein